MSLLPPKSSLEANLKSAINLAANRTGVRGPNGEIRSDLSYEQRVAFNKELAEIILAGGIYRFPVEAIRAAESVKARGYQNLSGLGVGEGVWIFLGEVGNQAVDLSKQLNPFDQSNRGMLRNFLIVGAVLAAAVYFGPALLQGSRRLKSSFK